jgi:CheY-like chemotaxis protein
MVREGGQDDLSAQTLFSSDVEVTCVSSIENALKRLANEPYDAVYTQAPVFQSLDRLTLSGRAVDVLNTIGEGVCLIDVDGQAVWENTKMGDFDSSIRAEIHKRSCEAYQSFAKQISAGSPATKLRPRKHSLTTADSNRYFEMLTTPMLDDRHELNQVATVVFEATEGRKLQQRINAIDRAGRELVRFDAESLVGRNVEQRIRLIQDKVVKYAKDLLHFDHFVVRLLNAKTNQLEVLFGVGLPPEAEELEIFANGLDNGITGYVVSTGRSYICNDPDSDPRYLPGLPDVKSTLTVPLRIYDNIIGALNVESATEKAFAEEDRQVAEIFSRYIAIALNILDLMVTERFESVGQTTDHFSHEVAEPLSNIVTAATTLMEDYIGHDDMRHRLQEIVDSVTHIRTCIKDAQAGGQKGILPSRVQEKTPGDPLLSGKLVLVVDDEPFIRQTISDVVQKHQMLADMAKDGREAISLISQKNYDLVISDIKLPYASGYDVFAAAREKDNALPVILMTGFGYDPNHSIIRANREGLSSVLYKPFKIDQLLVDIRQAISL